ncbi:MAG: hypothetical protein HY608_09950 [Planctomycetes bacterium]|nr:hypothetical protein [Planctomycetota bacterium]
MRTTKTLWTMGVVLTLAVAGSGRGEDANAAPQGIDPLVAGILRGCSQHTLAEAIRALPEGETAISAKYEFHDGHLALSVYSAGRGLASDAEHNVLKEYLGDPATERWAPDVEIFGDVAHVARSAEQFTLISLASITLADMVARAETETGGHTISITPVLRERTGYFRVRLIAHGDQLVEGWYTLDGRPLPRE